jgi:hypothetical protein
MEIRKIPETLVEIEAVADEKLVGDGEAHETDGQILHEPAVRTVEQGDGGEGRRRAERERLAEVVQRQAGVDHVFDDQDVPAGDLAVEVLQQPDARVAALVGAGGVARELEEVEPVGDADGAGEVGDEDEARLQRCDQERLAAVVVARYLPSELSDARSYLLAREVDGAEAWAAAYDASSSRYRSARRSMSRL